MLSNATCSRADRLLRRSAVVIAVFVLVVNAAIAGLSLVLRTAADEPDVFAGGVDNLRAVDDRLLRGGAPSAIGYRELARQGVTTVVDLRTERDVDVPIELLDQLGIDLVRLPIRDGQTPTDDQVRTFLDAVDHADGRVYVHCGAGVGRTGAMVAAYAVAMGRRSAHQALRDNLTIGPPSVEQIYYAAFVDTDRFAQPPALISTVSRFLDAPRRIWSRYGTGP